MANTGFHKFGVCDLSKQLPVLVRQVFATMFTACPVWIYLGMHSSIEIVACTVATSVLTALTPTIIWGLQSDMAPCGYMTKVVSASGKYGFLL